MVGIGTDIVEISRIEKALEKQSFLKRYFTENELEYFKSKNMKSETIAGTFAAKEAVVKALGTGFKGFTSELVEILHNEDGMPFVLLHGKADIIAKEKGITKILISISHSKDYAVGFAVAQGGI